MCLHGIVLVVVIELLKSAKDVFTNEIPVLQPAFLAFFIAYALPTFAMLKNDDLVAVLNHSRFGIYGSHAISQRGLRGSGNVEDFILFSGAMPAS